MTAHVLSMTQDDAGSDNTVRRVKSAPVGRIIRTHGPDGRRYTPFYDEGTVLLVEAGDPKWGLVRWASQPGRPRMERLDHEHIQPWGSK